MAERTLHNQWLVGLLLERGPSKTLSFCRFFWCFYANLSSKLNQNKLRSFLLYNAIPPALEEVVVDGYFGGLSKALKQQKNNLNITNVVTSKTIIRQKTRNSYG